MDLNLNKNDITNKKSNTKKYILNAIIIFFMLGSGGLLGESLSNGVTKSDYDKVKTEHDSSLNTLNSKQAELDKVTTTISEKDSNINTLNSKLEVEKKQQ